MTIKVKQTIIKEVEVSLPAFRKSAWEVVKIEQHDETQCAVERVWILNGNFMHTKTTEYSIDQYYTDEKFGPATEEDFEQQMSAMAALMSDNTENKAA